MVINHWIHKRRGTSWSDWKVSASQGGLLHRVHFVTWSWLVLHCFEKHFNTVWVALCCCRLLLADKAALSLELLQNKAIIRRIDMYVYQNVQSLPLGCAALTLTLFVCLLSSCDLYHHEQRIFLKLFSDKGPQVSWMAFILLENMWAILCATINICKLFLL